MNAENGFVACACPEYEVLLADYLDGALDNGSSRKVSEHLKACVCCSHALEDAAAASQWLRATEPASDPGPAFARIVMARIRTEEAQTRTSFWEPFVSLAWKFATTAALALVLLLAYASQRNNTVAENNTTATVSIPSDLQDMLAAKDSGVPANRSDMVRMVTESDNADQ
jgi:anti-sigma factor RsiW